MKIGAHFSIAKAVGNAVDECVKANATAIGMFVGSQRQWRQTQFASGAIKEFQTKLAEAKLCADDVLVHGSYLMNLGHPNDELLKKSRDHFIYEMQKCESLGVRLYNFHPGDESFSEKSHEKLVWRE
jgi:endonuclease IV